MVKDFDFPDSPRSDGHVQELEDGVRDGVVGPDEDSEVVFELTQKLENFFFFITEKKGTPERCSNQIGFCLTPQYYTRPRLKRLARDIHSCLFGLFISKE
jgi:hypothetical protein